MNQASFSWTRITAIVLAAAVFIAVCRAQSGRSAFHAMPKVSPSAAVVDLAAELDQARALERPLLVLIVDSGQNGADAKSRYCFNVVTQAERKDVVLRVVLDLSVSRNRATAARFHITDTDTPMLVCLSPRGIIISRDEWPLTSEIVSKRLANVAERGAQLDAILAGCEAAVDRNPETNPNDISAQRAIAIFLLLQKNSREAIPHLAVIAHSEAAEPSDRVHAWVELARAHLWIGEPEKGRHEAADLIATLGKTMPGAIAGGNLVRGLQDANAKRMALARQEFQAAVDAAPHSPYAQEAAKAIGKLPIEAK